MQATIHEFNNYVALSVYTYSCWLMNSRRNTLYVNLIDLISYLIRLKCLKSDLEEEEKRYQSLILLSLLTDICNSFTSADCLPWDSTNTHSRVVILLAP